VNLGVTAEHRCRALVDTDEVQYELRTAIER
jgi:hypothetical protein